MAFIILFVLLALVDQPVLSAVYLSYATLLDLASPFYSPPSLQGRISTISGLPTYNTTFLEQYT